MDFTYKTVGLAQCSEPAGDTDVLCRYFCQSETVPKGDRRKAHKTQKVNKTYKTQKVNDSRHMELLKLRLARRLSVTI